MCFEYDGLDCYIHVSLVLNTGQYTVVQKVPNWCASEVSFPTLSRHLTGEGIELFNLSLPA